METFKHAGCGAGASRRREDRDKTAHGRPRGNIALGRRFTRAERRDVQLRQVRVVLAHLEYDARLRELGGRQLSSFGEVSP